MTPVEKAAKYLLYMNEALKLPIVKQAVSRIYHEHLEVAWSPPQGLARVATRSDLFSSLGDLLARAPGNAILRAPAGHAPGHIIYGPYWRLPAGQYRGEISLELGTGGEEGERLCRMDIYDGTGVLGAQEIKSQPGLRTRTVAIKFGVPESAGSKPYEIRLWCEGKASVTVERVAFLQ